MNKAKLIQDLVMDEGLRLKPYKCTAGKLTIGIGRNLDDLGITQNEAEMLCANDIKRVTDELDQAMPWWKDLNEKQGRGLANMLFNLGLPRLLKFKKMLAALEAGNGKEAAEQCLDSRWADQVGERANRIAALFSEDRW